MAKQVFVVGQIHKPDGNFRLKFVQWTTNGNIWAEMCDYNFDPEEEYDV